MNLKDKIISFILVVIALIIVLQPKFRIAEIIRDNALIIVLTYVSIGMIFALFDRKQLVYVSLISALGITLYMKNISNDNLLYRTNDDSLPNLEVCHFNLIDFEGNNTDIIKSVMALEPEILTFDALSPILNKYLIKNLKDKYSYNTFINRGGDVDSKLVLSKIPIIGVDTFYLKGHPQLKVEVSNKNMDINLICSNITPVTYSNSNSISDAQVEELAEYVLTNANNTPTIVVGEFNQVYWSKNIRYLLAKTNLNNARRYVYLARRNPYDHIFYSEGLVCLKLEELFDKNSNNIGIVGNFILSNSNNDELTINN